MHNPSNLTEELTPVFRDVFDDDDIVLREEMTADDVEGWDSLRHIQLIVAIEKRYAIKFATAEISGLKAAGQNIGTFLRLIDKKKSAKR